MTGESRVTMHKGAAAFMAVALVLTGAGVSYLATRNRAESGTNSAPATPGAPSAQPSGAESSGANVGDAVPMSDVVVSLTRDAVERAGIVVAPVSSGDSATDIRLPGVVEPNA